MKNCSIVKKNYVIDVTMDESDDLKIVVDEDRTSTRLSGKNAMLLASAIPPSTDDDDGRLVVVLFVKRGRVSINALNTNGVAMVTPFPASINDVDAMTRCLMAMACCRCCCCCIEEVLS